MRAKLARIDRLFLVVGKTEYGIAKTGERGDGVFLHSNNSCCICTCQN